MSGSERDSPPRKRPRTKAPPRVAPAAPAAPATPAPAPAPAPAPKTDTSDSTPLPNPPHAPATMPQPPQSQPSETHRFSIQPLSRFQGASASIKRPREVAHFSYDDNHEYRDDDSSINYYVPPPIGADLKEGFETFRHYEGKDPHLDSLLRAVMHKESADAGSGAEIKADFVTWRGMMTKIMTAPYDNFAEFAMFATLHDGTIYIEEDFASRAASLAEEATRPPPRNPHPDQQSQAMMTYWGYKFETLSLIPTPPPNTTPAQVRAYQSAQTSNHAQHCSIVHTSFGPHTLLLGGEVDGLLGPKPSPAEQHDKPIPWVELKTAEQLPPPHRQQHRDVLRFERKLLKFWAQSFLLGVPTIIVGFRTKAGVLTGTQTFSTTELPGMVRRGTGCWDGNVCINFAAGFLGWLKEVITGEGKWSVVLRKKSGVVEVRRVGDGTGGVVSEEFARWREGRRGNETGEEAGNKEESAGDAKGKQKADASVAAKDVAA